MPALRRNVLPRMRNGRGRQARMPALLAPNDAPTRTEGVADAQVAAGACRIGCACVLGGALFCAAELASEYAGIAPELRRRPP